MKRMSLAEIRRRGLRISAQTPSSQRMGKLVAPRVSRLPDECLWSHVLAHYPEAQREYRWAVPNRRFRIDIALVDERIAIEVDGWQYHGKFKQAHEADRERQNLLAIAGWLVLRFTAGQIFKDLPGVSAVICQAVAKRRGE